MSFRSLLFCPDETTARLVTQVLTELDFTVEKENESFAAVERLSQEHFHALVVDCQNEQDASLLFKAARNSEQNGGSLSVAVVEGQAGVAKAFRIGANLVLTKPINVEQSKSTLRVARGLLKKAQPKSPGATTFHPAEGRGLNSPSETHFPNTNRVPAKADPVSATAVFSGITKPANPMTVTAAAAVPFSGLILESDPEPVTEAADAAVLDSMPEIAGVHSPEPSRSPLLRRAEPVMASPSGNAAAAAALAPEVKPTEFRPAGAAPMVTNEPILASPVTAPEPARGIDPAPVSTPLFSSIEGSRKGSGGPYLWKLLLAIALLGGGYLAWQQPKVQDFAHKLLNRGTSEDQSDPGSGDSHAFNQATTSRRPVENKPQAAASDTQVVLEPPPTASDESNFDSLASRSVPQKSGAPESIEVQELPITRDPGKITVTPKVVPIVVKNSTAGERTAPVLPPPVDVVADSADPKLPDLTPAAVELPKPAPGTVRISQGVSQGLLLKKVQPVYPSIAKQFGREGAVQLLATIDKYGEIKKVQVLSGDSLLARAAADAVKQWEYRPYLLNGQPVEIETQVTIVFRAK